MSAHVMLDLEAWGTAPGCALRSIGACVFDPYDEGNNDALVQFHFYANIDRESCEATGLVVDPQTVAWWERQSQAARDALLTEPRSIGEVVVEFRSWWLRNNAKFIWSNGAGFDVPILEMAMGRLDVDPPWKFWNVRDTRTIWDVAGINPKNVPRDGVAHNAYADARHQAKCVTLAYAKLGLSRKMPEMTSEAADLSIDTAEVST